MTTHFSMPGALRPLWPYQERALLALRRSLLSGCSHVIVQSPTGSGKTILAAHIIHGALAKGSPTRGQASRMGGLAAGRTAAGQGGAIRMAKAQGPRDDGAAQGQLRPDAPDRRPVLLRCIGRGHWRRDRPLGRGRAQVCRRANGFVITAGPHVFRSLSFCALQRRRLHRLAADYGSTTNRVIRDLLKLAFEAGRVRCQTASARPARSRHRRVSGRDVGR